MSRGSVVASIQTDVTPDVIIALQQDGLEMIGSTSAHGFVVDHSGVELLEPDEFEVLLGTMEMAKLMGARPVLCGLRPGVVSALVDLDVDLEEIDATRTIDDALDILAESHDEARQDRRRSLPVADDEHQHETHDPDPE